MSYFHQALCDVRNQIPTCFHSVFHFGSSLYSDCPNDIDVLAVYADNEDICHVMEQRLRLLNILLAKFEGIIVDLVTLSDKELRMSGFLQKTELVPLCDNEAPPPR